VPLLLVLGVEMLVRVLEDLAVAAVERQEMGVMEVLEAEELEDQELILQLAALLHFMEWVVLEQEEMLQLLVLLVPIILVMEEVAEELDPILLDLEEMEVQV
jgi:hypothetical protein